MLKRFAAILFVVLMTGHVFAGICGCLGNETKPQHSCCPHEKQLGDSMRAPNCCDTVCVQRSLESGPQYRSETPVKITFKARAERPIQQDWSFQPIVAKTIVTASPFVDHRLKYSRPPDLYLHHHAFLI